MGTTSDDVHEQEYLEEQFLEEERNKGIKEYEENKLFDTIELAEGIFSYCSSSPLADTYSSHLKKSISNGFWEYAILILWKTIILFFYEKLFQLYQIEKLNKKFLTSLENANRDCLSCFSFNIFKDTKLYEDMDLIWRNLDSNYKNQFRALLDERNSLSHVNEYPYSENKFNVYLEKTAELLGYLQRLHLTDISTIKESIIKNGSFLYLSQSEFLLLANKYGNDPKVLAFIFSSIHEGLNDDSLISELKSNAISIFLNAGSFASGYVYGESLIMPITSYFIEDDFKNILSTTNGQILCSGGIEKIFIHLYMESINNYKGIRESWVNFSNMIKSKGLQEQYQRLIELINEK